MPSIDHKNLLAALRHPSLVIRYLSRDTSQRLTERLVELETARVGRAFSKLDQESLTLNRLIAAAAELSIFRKAEAHFYPAPVLLYLIARLLRPERVLETGVKFGFSSAFILSALDDNERGALYSIDLPNALYVGDAQGGGSVIVNDRMPPGLETGAAVPRRLRNRWHLTIGKTQHQLVPLLERIGPVDLFFRDSEHRYEAMLFEFRTGWRGLTTGGILVSDNVDRNSAFSDFADEVGVEPRYHRYVGILQKA